MIALMELPLFVYGTLGSAFRNRWARRLWEGGESLGLARVRGQLYLLDGYPGMVRPHQPSDWVHGELVAPRTLLGWLDTYEGPLFHREACVAVTQAGARQDAWAYYYRGPLGAKRIWSGRFCAGSRFAHRMA